MLSESFTTLGVVPIFVNAGAALGPLIIAPIASFFVVLFKPRELMALIRRKPWAPLVFALIVAGIWWICAALLSSPPPARRADRNPPGKKDWGALALQLAMNEAMAGKKTGLRPLWSFDPEDGMVLSKPALVGGKVICPASVQDVSTYIGTLYAVDARNGKQLWKAEKAGDEDLKAFFSSPAITADGKSLIVGQGLHVDSDCALLCFSTETGQLRWKIKTPLHIESSPAIWGDMVVVGAGAIEDDNHKPTTHPGFVLAARISDGKELWRFDVTDPESSPAIAPDGTVYIGSGFNGNAIVALRSETDEVLKSKGLPRQLWKANAKYPMTGPVLLHEDLVIVGGGNGDFVWEDPRPAGVVMAIHRKDGSIKWETPMDAAVLGGMAIANGVLYCPVRNGQVAALNLADGKVIWKQSVSGKAPVLAGVVVEQNAVFAVSRDGYLALLNAASGAVIEKHPLNAPGKPKDKSPTFCLSTPVLEGDLLFVGSEAGGVRCFKLISTTPAPVPAAQTAGGLP